MKSLQPPEVDLGELSSAERTYQERHMPNVPESQRELKAQLQMAKYEATKMREWFLTQCRAFLPAAFPFEYLELFGEWRAKEALARDRLERMGWTDGP